MRKIFSSLLALLLFSPALMGEDVPFDQLSWERTVFRAENPLPEGASFDASVRVVRSDSPPKDLFEEELDLYRGRMRRDSFFLGLSVLGAGLSFVLSSAILTLEGLEKIPGNRGKPLVYSSYGLGAIGVFGAGMSFFFWKKNSELYMDTIRLKNQYYNLVR